MAVLAAGLSGSELTGNDLAATGEAAQLVLHRRNRQMPAAGGVGTEERNVCPGPANQQGGQRRLDSLQECGRKADRERDPQRVAISTGVFGRDPARFIRDPDPGGAPFSLQLLQPVGSNAARLRLARAEVAEPAERIGGFVRVSGPARPEQALELQLELVDRARIQQLAQLFG